MYKLTTNAGKLTVIMVYLGFACAKKKFNLALNTKGYILPQKGTYEKTNMDRKHFSPNARSVFWIGNGV